MKLNPPLTQNGSFDDKTKLTPMESQIGLTVVVAFQDRMARGWAIEVCSKVNRIVGDDCLESLWWEIGRSPDSTLFTAAAQAASEADIVIVALHATEELPTELCAWIDAWLPYRQPDEGALLALLGVSNDSSAESSRTRDYLRSVALRGRLEFLPREQNLPPSAAMNIGGSMNESRRHPFDPRSLRARCGRR